MKQALSAAVHPEKRFALVSLVFAAGTAAALGFMVLRVGQLQLAPGEALREQMTARTTTRERLPARGDLLDRRGRLIASTAFARRVVIDPTIFAVAPHLSEDIGRLARAAGVPEEELGARVREAIAENSRRESVAANWTGAGEEAAPVMVARGGEAPVDAPKAVDPFAAAQEEGRKKEKEAAGSPHEVEKKVAAAPVGPPKPIRYLPLTDILTSEQEASVRAAMTRSSENKRPLRGVVLERQQVRNFAGGDAMASLVGKVGFGHKGLMGAEYRLDGALTGEEGSLTYVRDRSGRPLWVEPSGSVAATPGQTVRLSLDTELQRIAHEEITAQVVEMNAAGGRCVIVDPATGEVLAMVDIVRDLPDAAPFPWVPAGEKSKGTFDAERRYQVIRDDPGRRVHPALARNRCVEDIYEPGSTFKPFVWSVITELGRARPDEVIDTEDGNWVTPDGRYLSDVTARSTMTWQQVLINSSNIGMVKVGTRLTPAEMREAVTRFGFGKRTDVGLPGEAVGLVTPLVAWKTPTHVSVSYGHELGVTPLQMVRAFSVFARTGQNAGTLPTLRLLAAESDESARAMYRVLPPDVAVYARDTMKFVVDAVDRNAAKKDMPVGGWRYSMFGKSGTAKIPLGAPPAGFAKPAGAGGYFDNQFISSFLAGAPVEHPKLVCLVVIDDPCAREGQSRRSRYGASAAGPAARRIMERSLTYLGVPATADKPLQ